MGSSPLLDFATLLAPVSQESPAGEPVPYAVREKLEECRREESPDDYAPDDPTRPQQATRADWPGIVKLTTETLTSSSKDLQTAARLTEALVKLHGFAGLRDGLRLLRQLVAECWDRLFPFIEDGDVEVRAGPFIWLDDPDRGARFPNAVRAAPLISAKGKAYGWLDWHRSQNGKGAVSRGEFEKVAADTPLEYCQQVAAEMSASLDELNSLTQKLTELMGQSAPGLTGIRQALEDSHRLLQQILQRKRPLSQGEPDKGNVWTSDSADSSAGPAASRDEAYRQLAHAAAVLRRLEPHSPIPYLVERAVKLGSLSFPDLIRELVRDMNVLGELNRELGIGNTESGESQTQETEA
jgi:type VI secretion system protein ImpA